MARYAHRARNASWSSQRGGSEARRLLPARVDARDCRSTFACRSTSDTRNSESFVRTISSCVHTIQSDVQEEGLDCLEALPFCGDPLSQVACKCARRLTFSN